MKPANSGVPVVLSIRIADIEFNTVMDKGFFGSFSMSPEIHSHPYSELITALNGKFRVEMLDGSSIDMTEGMVCIIPPEFHHATSALSENPEKLAVRFSYIKIKEQFETESVHKSFEFALSSIKSPIHLESPLLCELMKQIRSELLNMEIAADALVRSLIQQLYINLIRLLVFRNQTLSGVKPNNPAPDSNNYRYYRSEMYFAENYNKPITAEEMARELGLSKRQLSRVLRQIYNMSFREKLINTRLYRAAKLLARTDIPVEKIAAIVGYTTPSGFYAAFRKKFGVSGNEYRHQSKLKL